jgi:hypothetical protein
MTDIKSYRAEKEKREQKQEGYREKIKRHKLLSFYRLLAVAVVAIGLIALVVVQYQRHVYTAYDQIATLTHASVEGAKEIAVGGHILTYSKDGAYCTNAKGVVNWNQTYEMQAPIVSVSGETIAIGDYDGRDIYIQSTEKQLGKISTSMPLRGLTISEAGFVTALLADTEVTWVNTYNTKGELLYKGQTRMSDTGYPTSLSLSPDGELLCAAYAYVDAGVLKTNMIFYNFGAVGANNNDFIVSAYTYSDQVIPYVQFMNQNTSFAVGDNCLYLYTGAQKPVESAQFHFQKEVRAVYYSDQYVGLVFDADEKDVEYVFEVYSANAKKVGSFPIDIEYTDLFFEDEGFVVYNRQECRIVKMSGLTKFSGEFTEKVRLMVPAKGAYKYLLVTEESVDTVQLK